MPAITVQATVPAIESIEYTKDGRLHIISNTGGNLETTFIVEGKTYALVNCDLPEHEYIDTICDLALVVKVSGSTE